MDNIYECITSFQYGMEVGDRKELVRCKDCRHWTSEKILEYHICKRMEKTGVKNFATAWNWFCADGERKEGR